MRFFLRQSYCIAFGFYYFISQRRKDLGAISSNVPNIYTEALEFIILISTGGS